MLPHVFAVLRARPPPCHLERKADEGQSGISCVGSGPATRHPSHYGQDAGCARNAYSSRSLCKAEAASCQSKVWKACLAQARQSLWLETNCFLTPVAPHHALCHPASTSTGGSAPDIGQSSHSSNSKLSRCQESRQKMDDPLLPRSLAASNLASLPSLCPFPQPKKERKTMPLCSVCFCCFARPRQAQVAR